MPETTYCAEHSDTASNLRCSKCDKVICPRCMVQTPVGARCEDCARLKPPPVYDVAVSHLVRAILVSVLIGAAGGLAFGLLVRPVLLGLMYAAALGGLGYATAEGISRATNHKRGRALQYVAAGGVVLAQATILVTSSFGAGAFVDLFDFLGLGLGIYIAVIRLR